MSDVIIDGRYRVLERVGSGGMADVFCAEDLQLGRKVAVKVLHRRFAEDASFVERFRLEASSAAGLSHPNIVSIYDRGSWDGTYYIAMEYLEGKTLKEIIEQEGPLAPERAVDYAEQILKAARFAHSRSIIHRDLKPQNVIVGPDGRARVTDFGIAKAGSAEITETGSMMGTAQYVSPEQDEGKSVSAPSDLYAIGVILYEMLTGRVPFGGETSVAVALKHMQEEPVPPTRVAAGISPALEAVVLTAMRKQPEDRYQTADAFLDALNSAVARPQQAPPAPPVTAPSAPVVVEELEEESRLSRWWYVVAAGVLVLLALTAWVAWGAKDQVTVPSVVGAPQAEAQLQLKRAGFATDAQTKNSLTVPAGTVIGQDPEGGDQADKGSTVTITVSAGPGTARVPDLTGRPRSEALEELDKLGFEVSEERQSSNSIGDNRVIETRPAAGQELERGTTVTVVLSSGRARVAVPNVVGQPLDDARTELESAGFKVTVTRKESADKEPGTVLAQNPAAAAQAPEGSPIALTVAKAPAAVDVPDVVGSTQQQATSDLRGAGFKVVVRTVDVDDPTQDAVVTEQDTQGQAPKGSTVTITVGRFTQTTNTTTTTEGQ